MGSNKQDLFKTIENKKGKKSERERERAKERQRVSVRE